MGDAKDIPPGTYTLELGSSFAHDSRRKPTSSYHTLRYDFKPSSLAADSESYIAYGGTGDVHVALSTEGDNLTVFKGSKKEATPKECLMFFDRNTGTLRLEKITSSMNVKKTRDLDAGTEAALRNGIGRLRATSKTKSPPVLNDHPSSHQEKMSSSSSSSGSDSGSESDSSDDEKPKKSSATDSDSGSDVDESKLLEEMNAPRTQTGTEPNIERSSVFRAEPAFQSMPSFESEPAPRSRNGQAALGLVLSESSDDEEKYVSDLVVPVQISELCRSAEEWVKVGAYCFDKVSTIGKIVGEPEINLDQRMFICTLSQSTESTSSASSINITRLISKRFTAEMAKTFKTGMEVSVTGKVRFDMENSRRYINAFSLRETQESEGVAFSLEAKLASKFYAEVENVFMTLITFHVKSDRPSHPLPCKAILEEASVVSAANYEPLVLPPISKVNAPFKPPPPSTQDSFETEIFFPSKNEPRKETAKNEPLDDSFEDSIVMGS
ncbi:unnamed protein product [Caenorhabditis auriculariae]|uniref:Ell-associated factor Eaf n=1 Tax=Caenorhabditis auriculariae TaxID=2777116 RepID=A0A8S1H682_9PELO|nr:unnamed protein product [Caenorhabditis auriculariae]